MRFHTLYVPESVAVNMYILKGSVKLSQQSALVPVPGLHPLQGK